MSDQASTVSFNLGCLCGNNIPVRIARAQIQVGAVHTETCPKCDRTLVLVIKEYDAKVSVLSYEVQVRQTMKPD